MRGIGTSCSFGNKSILRHTNGAVTSITHKGADGSTIVQHSYTYDKASNIIEYLNSIDGTVDYDYDLLGQLVGAGCTNAATAAENLAVLPDGEPPTADEGKPLAILTML